MAFDVGAGLAQMGETSSKFAGLAALEQQKSGLEGERLKLANDLAMTRESAGRQQQHGLDLETLTKTQGFTSAENEKNRAAELERTKIMASSAAATAGAHLQGVRLQIEAMERQPDYKIGDDGTLLMLPKKTGAGGSVTATPVLGSDGAPMKVSNPEKAKAQAELLVSTRDQFTATARLYETDLKQARDELTAALKTPGAMVDPAKDPGVVEAKKNIDAIRQRYEPKITSMTTRMDQLYKDLGTKAGIPGNVPAGAPPLDSFLRPTAPETPPAPGMINGYGGPR